MSRKSKPISILMVFIFTIYSFLNVVPANAITKTAAKKQITSATALVVKAETIVKAASFNTKTATTAVTTAMTQVKKISTYGKSYSTNYTALSKRLTAVTDKINNYAAKQLNALKAAAEASVSVVEGLVDSTQDLSNNQALLKAQAAMQTATTAVAALKASISDYKGYAARLKLVNDVITKAAAAQPETSNTNSSTDTALLTAAEGAVSKVEGLSMNTLTDIAAIKILNKTASDAIAKVKDTSKAAGLTARLKAVMDKADAQSLYIPADSAVKAAETAQLNSVGDITTVSAIILKAEDTISKVKDSVSVSKLTDRLNVIKDKISYLSADAAVKSAETATLNNQNDLNNVNALLTKANDSIAKIKDAASSGKLTDRIKAVKDKLIPLTADLAVSAVENAPLATNGDLTTIIPIENAAMDAISKLNDLDKANALKARIKIIADKANALKAKLDQEAAAAAAPAKILSATSTSGKITVLFDKKPITPPSISNFIIFASINGASQYSILPTSLTVVNDTTVTINVATINAVTNLDQSVIYSVQYGTSSPVNASTLLIPKIPVISVLSVTPINLKQVKVVFSKEVDKSTAENIGNYAENSVTMSTPYEKAELQSDNASIIITYATAKLQQYSSVITVSNVRSKDLSEVLTTGVYNVNFMDVTPPSVASVVPSGNTSLKITFNEPVVGADVISAYKLDGYDLSAFGISGIAYDDTVIPSKQTSVTINFGTKLSSGAHTFTVVGSNIRDAANFYASGASMPFTVIQDTTEPAVISSEAVGLGTINFTFNKDVLLPSVSNIYVNGVALNGTATIGYKSDSSKATLTITKTALLAGGLNLINLGKSTVTDFYGNTNATNEIRFTVTAVPDTTPPTVTSVTASNDKTILVTYSEAMDIRATNKANYVIQDSTGAIVGTSGTINKVTGSDSSFNINLSSSLPGGSYTVAITGVTDISGNTVIPATKTFTVTDTTPPLPPTAILIDPIYKKIKVSFSEAMDVTSITSLSNYKISLVGGTVSPTYVDLDPAVTITPSSDYKSVTLDFPDNTPISTSLSTLKTVLIKDKAQNFTAAITDYPILISATSAITPTFLRASATSQNTLQVEYNGPLSYVDANDFTYNGTPAQLASLLNTKVVSSDKQTQIDGCIITLTFGSSIIDPSASGTLYAIAPIGTMDQYMNPITSGLLANAGSITDKIAPKLVSANIVNSNTIDITFNETMQAGISLLFMNDLSVINGGANIKIDSSSVIGTKVRLTLDTALNLTQLTYVIPKTLPTNIQDLNGNLYVPTAADLAGCQVTQ